MTDKIRKERREFHIPKLERERSLYGSEFEIQLRNKFTQRAIARECADWLRRKARFKSNRSKSPMQQFACVQSEAIGAAAYMPLHGFTAVDLGYQQGNAVSNLVNKIDEPSFTATYLSLFEQIWSDSDKLEDVTSSSVRISPSRLVVPMTDIRCLAEIAKFGQSYIYRATGVAAALGGLAGWDLRQPTPNVSRTILR